MARTWLLCSLLLVAACGGAAGQTQQAPAPQAVGTPDAAVQRFMQAVADSNLSALADAWGTAQGPASKTKPNEWQRRVAIMQAYLRGGSYRILGTDKTVSSSNAKQQTVLLELTRDACTRVVPFGTSQLGNGNWLVTNVDLAKAGVPGRPCEKT